MSEPSLYEKIVAGTIPSFKVWEDEAYIAFLTPWPNTPGLTVVTPKQNPGPYVFDLSDEQIAGLMIAVRKVAKLLEKALDVKKVGIVIEGEGVSHVHVKMYPMYGIETGKHAQGVHHQEFYPEYPGWISTVEGPRMSDDELKEIQAKIKKAAA